MAPATHTTAALVPRPRYWLSWRPRSASTLRWRHPMRGATLSRRSTPRTAAAPAPVPGRHRSIPSAELDASRALTGGAVGMNRMRDVSSKRERVPRPMRATAPVLCLASTTWSDGTSPAFDSCWRRSTPWIGRPSVTRACDPSPPPNIRLLPHLLECLRASSRSLPVELDVVRASRRAAYAVRVGIGCMVQPTLGTALAPTLGAVHPACMRVPPLTSDASNAMTLSLHPQPQHAAMPWPPTPQARRFIIRWGMVPVLQFAIRADRNRERKAGPIDISLNEPVGNLKPLPQRAKPPVPDSERLSDPFKPEQVAEIMSKIRIGDKLSEAQRSRVQDLIREFADVFARNLSEVLPVEFTQMKLDVPEGTTFPKRAGQKKFTEPQRQALGGLSNQHGPEAWRSRAPPLTTLQQMANSECRKYGLPIEHPEVDSTKRSKEAVRPFPMGDLGAKQQAVAGREFVSVMDLQAGFHAIPIAPEHSLHRVLWKTLEVWMDDMATAADDFDTGMGSLRLIFERCRTHKISLSAAKTVLFMSEATFAGARVSKAGIKRDPAKVRAILEWPEPKSVLDTMGFLGLAGSQRAKIKNFGRIAQPLSDLTRDVCPAELAKGSHDYKRALREAKVELDVPQQRAFVKLKVALTSDPVLRAPVYDGRPFIITTDGSKFGFGATLSQEWEETGPDGRTHKVTYPVAYASKRTSRTEERYIPFLLEFAALKFACDEFDSLIFGQAIELETDCKALADLLGNEKLNSTHERWRESIIARNIVAVRHLRGKDNKACDALSRMYEGRQDSEEGPGRHTNVDPGWESKKDLLNDMYHLVADTSVADLLRRFEADEYFSDILLHLLFEDDADKPISADAQKERARRTHKAEGYLIVDGKLWLAAGKHARNGDRVECIPVNEGKN
ncbi:Retrovirus-related Pol polyprotein from transposon opus [Ceratobasidium sp. AG-Ba]|nr:Retrovirus-related Pol polyprotein from transposon opus [Ceratobasidium sp. AG-Ba]